MCATIDTVVSTVVTARTELMLFCIAFVMHYFLFGGTTFRRSPKMKTASPGSPVRARPCHCSGDALDTSDADERALAHALQSVGAAAERGDHRTVLRYWPTLKHGGGIVSVGHLVRVVGAMQQVNFDAGSIVSELHAHLHARFHGQPSDSDLDRGPARDDDALAFVNELLAALAKSFDARVVNGIFELLPSLGVAPDGHTHKAELESHRMPLATEMFNARLLEHTQGKTPMHTASIEGLARAQCMKEFEATEIIPER